MYQDQKRSGRIVKDKDGNVGVTYHDDKPVNGKLLVYFLDKSKRLCNPQNLETLGYQD